MAIWVRARSLFAWVHSYAPGGRRVDSCSRGFTLARLGIVRFIRVRFGLFRRTQGSSGSVGFSWVHSCARRGPRVH